jgi:hypothetical protein
VLKLIEDMIYCAAEKKAAYPKLKCLVEARTDGT